MIDYKQNVTSINPDGSRNHIAPADVTGVFTRYRKYTFVFLIVLLVVVPFLKIGGNPVLLLDIPGRHFHFLGMSFNAQDSYLLFFLISGIVFGLFFITALFGRVWCGWACPQTVFMEGVFRRIERFIEGPRPAQIALRNGPWNFKRVYKFVLKQSLFIGISFFLSHVLLSYFVPTERLFHFMLSHPSEHPIAFGWAAVTTLVIYLDFAWFREQLCLIVCPYGRLQSVLTDDDSVVIGYDQFRGEPRGKKADSGRGACISCNRCVQVCPTGIDIRNGLQLECIGCANCIDACDEVMDGSHQARGLIRYDSLAGFKGGKTKFLRPRIGIYFVLMIIGLVVSTTFYRGRSSFEANLLRVFGAPYTLVDSQIRNQFDIHLINKNNRKVVYTIVPEETLGVTFIQPVKSIELDPFTDKHIPFFAEMKSADYKSDFNLSVTISDSATGESKISRIEFLGPK